jgi:DNA-binding response OmpR family regulator
MKKILIIEDDKDINNMLNDLLVLNGYKCISAYSGTEALLICNDEVDLILLDLMLPGKGGSEIIADLKAKHNIPVIVTTAISDIDTKLNLFELGADDYVVKPFDNKELLARIKVKLKKNTTIDNNTILKYKDIIMDLNKYEITCNNKSVSLSKIEYELLKVLISNPNKVFTKNNLYELVWDTENSADDNTLNVHISKIRTKLKMANDKEDYIETIWSIGYKMK